MYDYEMFVCGVLKFKLSAFSTEFNQHKHAFLVLVLTDYYVMFYIMSLGPDLGLSINNISFGKKRSF